MKATSARQHSPLRWAIKGGVIVLIIAFFGAFSQLTSDVHETKLDAIDNQRQLIFEEASNNTNSDGEDDCPGFNTLTTDEEKCTYLQNECAPDGYINYLQIYYCKMPNIKWVAWIIFILWVLIMFYGLGAAASDYFCPSLSSIADYLRMSPDVAGLTILALGNGAPDVSSTFAAVTSNTFNIAIGELLGAGLFVTTAVVAAVSFASEAFLDRKSFLRDAIFYLFGVVGVMIIVHDGEVHLFESIIFLGYYFTYVGIALAVNYCKCGSPKTKALLLNEEDGEKAPLINHDHESITSVDKQEPTEDECFSFEGWRRDWSEKSAASKAFFIITLPVSVLLALTIPQSSQWNKYTALFVGVFSPVFSQWVLGYLTEEVMIGGKEVPVASFTAAGGLVISILIALLTKTDKKPKAYSIFTFWAFVLSIFWIYIIANELVSFLQSIGYILNVSRIILGATVLAWGNSIGDMVADVLMARQGLPQMAISATYGGPCFNLLFGLGLSFVVVCIKQYPQNYPVEATPLFYLTALFLIGSLAASIVVISVSKFFISKKWGFVLLGVYVVYSVFLILGELHILF